MKKTLLLLCALFTAWTQASADEMATLSQLNIAKGGTGTATVTINASGTEQTAFQLFIDLPNGVSVTDVKKASTATTDHAVAFNTVENQLRIVVYSMTLAKFKAGEIITIDFSATTDANIPDTNDLASFAFATPESTENNVAGQFVVNEGSSVTKGDVNGDGNIDINDVMDVVTYILKKPITYFKDEAYFRQAADMNNDGNININDVMDIVAIILNRQ